MNRNDQPPQPGDLVISGSGPWDGPPGPPSSEREREIEDKISDLHRPGQLGGPSR